MGSIKYTMNSESKFIKSRYRQTKSKTGELNKAANKTTQPKATPIIAKKESKLRNKTISTSIGRPKFESTLVHNDPSNDTIKLNRKNMLPKEEKTVPKETLEKWKTHYTWAMQNYGVPIKEEKLKEIKKEKKK